MVNTDDVSRLVIDCGGDAQNVLEKLEKKGIYCEAAIGENLVLIVTPHNVKYLDILSSALEDITPAPLAAAFAPKLKMSAKRDGRLAVKRIEQCTGAVCGVDICLYPPGTPVIRRGEILDENAVQFIKDFASRLSPLAYGGVIVLE